MACHPACAERRECPSSARSNHGAWPTIQPNSAFAACGAGRSAGRAFFVRSAHTSSMSPSREEDRARRAGARLHERNGTIEPKLLHSLRGRRTARQGQRRSWLPRAMLGADACARRVGGAWRCDGGGVAGVRARRDRTSDRCAGARAHVGTRCKVPAGPSPMHP